MHGSFLQILIKVARVGEWRLWYKSGIVYILSFHTEYQKTNAFWAWLFENINIVCKCQLLGDTYSQIKQKLTNVHKKWNTALKTRHIQLQKYVYVSEIDKVLMEK